MTPEQFQPHLGKSFRCALRDSVDAVEAELIEVNVDDRDDAIRTASAPFTLLFRLELEQEQGSYLVEGPDGEIGEIFMTPVSAGSPGHYLEAVFN